MGMAVKGANEHRLVRRALVLLSLIDALTPEHRADVGRLIRRADLAIDRVKKRKVARARRHDQEAARASTV